MKIEKRRRRHSMALHCMKIDHPEISFIADTFQNDSRDDRQRYHRSYVFIQETVDEEQFPVQVVRLR
jgi:hypothetical protein